MNRSSFDILTTYAITHSVLTTYLVFAAIERQISVRSTREDLIRRGILKDTDLEESDQLSAATSPAGDRSIISGDRIVFVLL